MKKPNNQRSSAAKASDHEPNSEGPELVSRLQESGLSDEIIAQSNAAEINSVKDLKLEQKNLNSADETGLVDKAIGTVVKTWASGGAGGTATKSAKIVAQYSVAKDLRSGAVEFASSAFELTFTDIDKQTSSQISEFPFKSSSAIEIPKPDGGADFDLNGTVWVSAEPSGRIVFVDFDMSGNLGPDAGSTPHSVGAIFALDVPEDTDFSSPGPKPVV